MSRNTGLPGGQQPIEEGQEGNTNRLFHLPNAPLSISQPWSFDAVPNPQQSDRPESSRTMMWRDTHRPRSATPGPPSGNMHRQAESAGRHGYDRRREREDRPNSTTSLSNPEADRRRRRPMTNPFGTREEVESESYQSPVADLFGRAWNRYREAQEANRTPRNRAENERPTAGDVSILGTGPPRSDAIDLDRAMAFNRMGDINDERSLLMALEMSLIARQREQLHAHPRANPIDQQSTRPPPLGSEEMTISVACRICCEQRVDTLLEPCMHVAICHWCSELVREAARRRRTERVLRPDDEDRWRCPICRRDVIQSRRVYLT
ncbi:hypothetical protein A1O1_07517 [Capronia coronata CBS 617.96]|uniref:RING-type domain-containing protein n=1 Tax=Capronia coronata CBS 617.96 TaxID=1182541 RepID=W9XUK5_9EURO|nr:uncharacterized protein A1O1_07517 [Capronia coronata CBS 617.96]EXJ83888.1 hypothetical protein A1O1_07517 [Capronia coronata CBS 617.96]